MNRRNLYRIIHIIISLILAYTVKFAEHKGKYFLLLSIYMLLCMYFENRKKKKDIKLILELISLIVVWAAGLVTFIFQNIFVGMIILVFAMVIWLASFFLKVATIIKKGKKHKTA